MFSREEDEGESELESVSDASGPHRQVEQMAIGYLNGASIFPAEPSRCEMYL